MKRSLLLLALLVVLTGCGDKAESDSASVQATSVPTPTAITVQSASAGASTTTTVPGAKCQTVVFAPSTVEVARDVVAYGIPCTDAEAVVTKVGSPLGPEGPAQAEADGFTCSRTSVQIGHSFPVATYECKRGSDRITFSRTTAG